jgi:hypothetical protein
MPSSRAACSCTPPARLSTLRIIWRSMSSVVSSSERPDSIAPSWAPSCWIAGGRWSGRITPSQQDGALKDVLQLAAVSRPGVRPQTLQRLVGSVLVVLDSLRRARYRGRRCDRIASQTRAQALTRLGRGALRSRAGWPGVSGPREVVETSGPMRSGPFASHGCACYRAALSA